MKKWWLLVLLVALVATLFGVGTFAMAQEATLSTQLITQRYVEMGTVYAVAAYGDTACVLREADETAYLSLYGDTQLDVPLSVDASKLGSVRVAMYDHTVLLDLGDYITAYDWNTGKWRNTKLPTTLVQTGLLETRTPLSAFAVDAADGNVYVCYDLIVAWVPFSQLFDETQPFGGSLGLSKDTQNYTDFTVYQGKCYFYHASGNAFCIDTATVSMTDVYAGEAIEDFAYADGALYLRGGEVQNRDGEVVLPSADEMHTADAYLRHATAFCASYGANGWRLWVVDNGQHALKMYDGQYRYDGMYGADGDADGRLRNPTGIGHDALTVINDAGNRRVVVVQDEQYVAIDVQTDSVATVGSTVYLANGAGILAYDFDKPDLANPYTVTDYVVPEPVLSVCCDSSSLYALTSQWLYLLLSQDQAVRQLACPDGVQAKVGKHAGIVYVQTQSAITEYKDLQPVGVSLDIADMDVLDFDMDYCGNLYVLLSDGTLQVWQRTVDGYTIESAFQTQLSAICVCADGTVLSLYRSALASLPLTVKTQQNSQYEAPQWAEELRAVRVNDTVWGYTGPNNYESIVNVPQSTVALLLAEHTYQETDFYYVEFAVSSLNTVRYERVYIPQSAVTVLQSSYPENLHVRYDGPNDATGVYAYPAYSAPAVGQIARKDAMFEVIRVVGVLEDEVLWPWYQIEYDGTAVFVAIENYTPYEVTYPDVPRYEARCVATKLGQKVNVYAAPSEDAEVVDALVDGTKIEMTAPYDAGSQFTCIRLGDREVYILTANVTTRTITNGQTLALIMSVVVIVAALVTAVLYVLARKKK